MRIRIPPGSTRIEGEPGIYRTPEFHWFVRVTITEGGVMLRDMGELVHGSTPLEQVIQKREDMRKTAREELDKSPQCVEILDRDGVVIWGMKRDRVVKPSYLRNARPDLDDFISETTSREDVLRELFADSNLDSISDEQPSTDHELLELVDLFDCLVDEFDSAIEYVRTAGATVRAERGDDLVARSRRAIKAFHQRKDASKKTD